MTEEIKIIPGKCNCSKCLDLRIASIDDENSYWIIYGICKPCNKMYAIDLFAKVDEPKEGIDFIIEENKCVGKIHRGIK